MTLTNSEIVLKLINNKKAYHGDIAFTSILSLIFYTTKENKLCY